ncbi:F-box only protein 34 [Betta splendens]|uniref:F-box only protein 34 n=1 Tax=Betta splendens TaxID=158456 RepID=A0A6P7LJD4_BETSP|nr:F-box only protein 34 [Betta splendens]XP_028993869.1 F-box only protein 34 [Betta splendens]XP_028993871.1 F-box only protein 34 [Betta splendens]XP_028993872.1 F-box only protein 34 [Betta splendens]XP_055361377.1 F-box only protein 34 [Betta splendens]XP_055361378.1 F-box only protein 34 [Betta splendens]
MHLKSCSKLTHSEVRLNTASVTTSSQQSLVVDQQGTLRRTCSSNHENFSSGRVPLSTISTNGNNGTLASPTLQPISSVLGSENDPFRLYQSTTDDANTPLDIWTVIKPGHVREKIAIFASEGHADGAAENVQMSPRAWDRSTTMCITFTDSSGLPRATKAKGSWEENCSAKRRRRSGNNQNQSCQQDQRTRALDTRQPSAQLHSYRSDMTWQSGIERCGTEVVTADEELEHKVSVVEMVAFLEQRESEQQPDCKPLLALQRTSTTITLSKPLPPDARGEELESIRVSEMVAKLESECRRRKAEGDLSRSNSLKRAVGQVTSGHSSAHSQLLSSMTSSFSSSLSGDFSCSESVHIGTAASAVATPSSPCPGELVGEPQKAECQISKTDSPALPPEEAEPLPGLLFLSPHEPHPYTSVHLVPNPGSQSGKWRRHAGPEGQHVSTSQDFLKLRRRLQQLLAPQPYLAVLPHHLLVKIFLLLPTQSLVALKCTCHYFKFVIENYGVRPSDSLWVSDPRYRDDPCKQCKKRYDRGDVSLCRWHHKPFCQALPYGPGYWMCCHGPYKDTPGCNVGLHDNRWVPPFHSINMPIYRRSHCCEGD